METKAGLDKAPVRFIQLANTEFQRVITMIGHLAATSEENAAAMEEISSSISEENKMLKFIASSAKELDGLDGELQTSSVSS